MNCVHESQAHPPETAEIDTMKQASAGRDELY